MLEKSLGMLCLTVSLAVGTLAAQTVVEDRKDVRHDRRELRKDRKDLRHDRRERLAIAGRLQKTAATGTMIGRTSTKISANWRKTVANIVKI